MTWLGAGRGSCRGELAVLVGADARSIRSLRIGADQASSRTRTRSTRASTLVTVIAQATLGPSGRASLVGETPARAPSPCAAGRPGARHDSRGSPAGPGARAHDDQRAWLDGRSNHSRSTPDGTQGDDHATPPSRRVGIAEGCRVRLGAEGSSPQAHTRTRGEKRRARGPRALGLVESVTVLHEGRHPQPLDRPIRTEASP